MTAPMQRIEVITRDERRRRLSIEEKREIVVESLGPRDHVWPAVCLASPADPACRRTASTLRFHPGARRGLGGFRKISQIRVNARLLFLSGFACCGASEENCISTYSRP
jgi:hypothetical protein